MRAIYITMRQQLKMVEFYRNFTGFGERFGFQINYGFRQYEIQCTLVN